MSKPIPLPRPRLAEVTTHSAPTEAQIRLLAKLIAQGKLSEEECEVSGCYGMTARELAAWLDENYVGRDAQIVNDNADYLRAKFEQARADRPAASLSETLSTEAKKAATPADFDEQIEASFVDPGAA